MFSFLFLYFGFYFMPWSVLLCMHWITNVLSFCLQLKFSLGTGSVINYKVNLIISVVFSKKFKKVLNLNI